MAPLIFQTPLSKESFQLVRSTGKGWKASTKNSKKGSEQRLASQSTKTKDFIFVNRGLPSMEAVERTTPYYRLSSEASDPEAEESKTVPDTCRPQSQPTDLDFFYETDKEASTEIILDRTTVPNVHFGEGLSTCSVRTDSQNHSCNTPTANTSPSLEESVKNSLGQSNSELTANQEMKKPVKTSNNRPVETSDDDQAIQCSQFSDTKACIEVFSANGEDGATSATDHTVEEWAVNRITGEKVENGQLYYLVEWEDTWVCAEDAQNATDLINAWEDMKQVAALPKRRIGVDQAAGVATSKKRGAGQKEFLH